jgi:uncharacterized protein (TIGR03435 family)
LGQQPNPSLTFEVATVKAAAPPSVDAGKRMVRFGAQGGPGTNDPGQITYNFLSLRDLITQAYGVRSDQVSGPPFLTSDRFNIVAKIAPGATKDDVKVMLQNLLKERFQLALHRENKELPVYELVVGKDGPKLKESADQSDPEAAPRGGAAALAGAGEATPPAPPPDPGKIKFGKDGMPEIPAAMRRPGVMMMAMMSPTGARVKMDGNRATMAQLVENLSNQVDRPVLDKTGLAARYDFILDFAPDQAAMMAKMAAIGPPPPPPGAGPGPGPGGDAGPRLAQPETDAMPLFPAIQKQLGLRLEPKKDAIDLLVIDHVERTPTEN